MRKLVCHHPNAKYTECDWKTCPIQMPRKEWADLIHHYCEFRYAAEEKRVK